MFSSFSSSSAQTAGRNCISEGACAATLPGGQAVDDDADEAEDLDVSVSIREQR